MKFSLIVPMFDERESLDALAASIREALHGKDYETIFVDDGSTDGSADIAERLDLPGLRVVRLGRRAGKTEAWRAGFAAASSERLVTLDADLQNDPRDIPLLLEKLDSGYGCAGGWRVQRKDPPRRERVSRAANALLGALFGCRVRDLGCGLKAFRRDALRYMRWFPGAHRYAMILLARGGVKVVELPVRHHERRYGKSKYRARIAETAWGMFRVITGL